MAQLEHITPEQIEEYGVVAAPDRLTGKARDNKMIFDRLVRELVAVVVNSIIDKTNELLVSEDERDENEAKRVAAELLRVEAENLRVEAEKLRVRAEEDRDRYEWNRIRDENNRGDNETARIQAENERKEAEQKRELAEQKREDATNGIVAQATEQAQKAEESAKEAEEYTSNIESFKNEAEASAVNAQLWADGTVEELVYNLPYIRPGETKTVQGIHLLEGFYYLVTGTGQEDGALGPLPITPVEGPFTGEIIVDALKIRNGSSGGIVCENTSATLIYSVTITRLARKPEGFMSAKDWAGEAEQSVDAAEETAQNASGSASAAAQSAVDAEHWAIGGTVTYTYQTVNVTPSKPAALSDNKPLQDGASYTADIHLVVNRVIGLQPDPQNPDVNIPIYGFVDVPLSGTGTYDQRAGALVIEMVRIQQMEGYLECSLTAGNYGGDQIVDCEVTLHGKIAWDEGISAKDSAKTAESWAVGGTGSREGEDTNNARYWAEQAKEAAGGTGEFLPTSGGEITGNLSVRGKISTPRIESGSPRPIEIPYANFSVGLSLDAEANTDFRGVKLQNIGAPSSDSDAATKKYVDDTVGSGGGSYVLPAATSNLLGGVKADASQAADTQPVRIGEDNKLYTAPGGKSPYEIAVEQGYTGTKEEFNSALAELVDLEQRVSDLEYKPIAITAFSVSQTVAELGSTVDSVSLTYALSKAPAALALDGEAVTPMEQSGTITKAGLALKQDKTWTLTATDEREATASKTAALRFYNGVYYGASPDRWEGLTKTLTNSRGRTFTVDAAAGEYIWYALPKRLGAPTFTVGGFEGGFELREEVAYTNPSGYEEVYLVYRSTNAGLGSTTVTVS